MSLISGFRELNVALLAVDLVNVRLNVFLVS